VAFAAGLLFAAGSTLFGLQIFRIATNRGVVVIEVDDPAIEVTVDDSSIIVRDGPARREMTLAAGDHIFHVTVHEASGPMSFDSDAVTIDRGGKRVFNVRQEIARYQARTKSALADSPQKIVPTVAAPAASGTAPPANGDRIAAEWALATGGVVTVAAAGKEQALQPGQKLPEGDVRLLNVDLRERPVTGTGLATLERTTTLKELNLSQTDATDSWLTSIGKLVHLKELDLGDTKISEAGLQKLAALTELRVLSLWRLNITDAGLKHLAGLKKLQVVNLSYTQVTGTGFADLKDLKQLFYLRLHDSLVNDASVQSIHDLPNDRTLTLILSRTKLTDAGLSRLRGRSIWELHLGGLPITDKGLTNLGITEMPYLSILHLPGTEVTDAGVATILQVRTLNDIDLSETNVSARGFASLKRVFPQATLQWSEPNVTAARAVFKAGGTVSVRRREDSTPYVVQRGADLPLDSFAVTAVNLAGTKTPLVEVLSALAHPRLRELVSLDLSDHSVSTDDIQQISRLVRLRRLVLNRAQIRGEDLVLLERLPQLVELELACPSLDLLLIESGGFLRLERLSLATSGITDDSVAHLARLAGLKELDLTGTKISAAGVAALQKSLPECRIVSALGKH
jgi:Leucine-rich repeat (LRR) protein